MAAIWWQAKAEMSQMCDRHPKALLGNSLPLRAAHGLRKGVLTTPAGTQDQALTRRLKRVTMPARKAGLSASVRSVKTGYCPLSGMVFQASMAPTRQLYQVCGHSLSRGGTHAGNPPILQALLDAEKWWQHLMPVKCAGRPVSQNKRLEFSASAITGGVS